MLRWRDCSGRARTVRILCMAQVTLCTPPRTTRDNLELHYAQYTWLSSLCAFWRKGILHFITSVRPISGQGAGKRERSNNNKKSCHFIIYSLEGIFFPPCDTFSFSITFTECVHVRCTTQTNWPVAIVLDFRLLFGHRWFSSKSSLSFRAKHGAEHKHHTDTRTVRETSNTIEKRRIQLELSKFVTSAARSKLSINIFVFFGFGFSMQQMVCRFYLWRRYSPEPCWRLASPFYWLSFWPYESDATPSPEMFATTRTNISVRRNFCLTHSMGRSSRL